MLGGKAILKAGAAAVLMLAAAVPAAAAVTYSFAGFSSFGFTYGSFVFTVPNYITSPTFIPAAALTSCTVTFAAAPTDVCAAQSMNVTPSYDVVGFGYGPNPLALPSLTFFYFSPGSFAANGTYNSLIFGESHAGILTVSGAGGGGGGAVPEPASWAMLLAGFGAVGATLRRRRAVAA